MVSFVLVLKNLLSMKRNECMKKIPYFYLEFVKILFSAVLLFAIFGTVNDIIIKLITGYSFPNVQFLENKQSLTGLFILQYIGFALIYFVIYKNYLSIISFNKEKQHKKLPSLWSKYFVLFGAAFILLFYIVLLLF
jgi:hypothetical protein